MDYMRWLKFSENFIQGIKIKDITLAPESIVSLFLGFRDIYIDQLNSLGKKTINQVCANETTPAGT